MLWLGIDEARPGMTLAASIAQPAGDGDLVRAGVTLDAALLGRLGELGIRWLCVAYEPLAPLGRHLALADGEAAAELRRVARGLYARATPGADGDLPLGRVYGCVRDLLSVTVSFAGRGIYYDLHPRDADDLPAHVSEVAFLSILLGARLERYIIKQRHRLPPHHARELINLGVGALLHDIGKTRQDATLRKFHMANPPGDAAARAEWQSHARLGYELVKDGVEASAATTVLHHHQHMDGSGFPKLVINGKRVACEGTRLHVFARIVAVANAFDRLSSAGTTQGRRSTLETLAKVREVAPGKLDKVIVRALHDVCPPFAPGSLVTLDDQTQAVVVQTNDSDPFRPVVRRLDKPAEGEMMPTISAEPVDLRVQPGPRIVRAGKVSTEGLMVEPPELEAMDQWPAESPPTPPVFA